MANYPPTSIAIAMCMMYPKWYKGPVRSIKHTDKIRGDLALQTVKEAQKKGYQVAIIERKSSKTFEQTLYAIRNISIKPIKSTKFAEAKRRVLLVASKLPGVQAIVLTEPEKVSLITDCIDLIVDPILSGKADIVVPKREDALFKASYPDYMYQSEVEGNSLYNEMLVVNGFLSKKDELLDMFFGPRVIKNDKKIIELFLKKFHIKVSSFSFPTNFFDTEHYSNSLYFPILRALKKKFIVKSVTVPFTYPKIQKDNEEKGEREIFIEKRKNQRLTLLVELLHFVSFLEKNKASGVKQKK